MQLFFEVEFFSYKGCLNGYWQFEFAAAFPNCQSYGEQDMTAVIAKAWLAILIMERFAVEQRIFIVKTYSKNGENLTQIFGKIREQFGRRGRPNRFAIEVLIRKFESTGSIGNVNHLVRVGR